MNIGFDLDKVLINHPPLVPYWLIQKLYGEKSNGHLSYRIPGALEQRFRQFTHIPLFRPAMIKNINTIKRLSQDNRFHLFLISSRFQFLHKQTERVMGKYKIKHLFPVIDFNDLNEQPHQFKLQKISEYHIDRFVDDDLPLLMYLAKKLPKVTFFWLNNSRNDKIVSNLFAITDISTVFLTHD